MSLSNTRRTLLMGGLAVVPLIMGLSACSTGVSFQTVQAYVVDADAVLDRLAPLVSALDPKAAAQLSSIQAEADAAAQAFASLTSAPSGSSTAQAVLTAISDAFTLIEAIPGIPPDYVAAIAAAQLLLVAVGAFFNISTTTAPTAVALAHPAESARLWNTALTQYQAASNKAQLSTDADNQVRAWLATH